jgi:hypothetical protein
MNGALPRPACRERAGPGFILYSAAIAMPSGPRLIAGVRGQLRARRSLSRRAHVAASSTVSGFPANLGIRPWPSENVALCSRKRATRRGVRAGPPPPNSSSPVTVKTETQDGQRKVNRRGELARACCTRASLIFTPAQATPVREILRTRPTVVEGVGEVPEMNDLLLRNLGCGAAIGQVVGTVLGQRHMAKHFQISIGDDAFSFAQNHLSIAAEAALDGIYVVRTNLPAAHSDAPPRDKHVG